MNIGEEQRTIHVEPVRPVVPKPEPRREPTPKPVPVRTPERERVA